MERYEVAKDFEPTIGDGVPSYQRRGDQTVAEAASDCIHVLAPPVVPRKE